MKIASTILSSKTAVYGSFMGIWLSPMLISIGYIIGPVVIGVWFLGAHRRCRYPHRRSRIGTVGFCYSGRYQVVPRHRSHGRNGIGILVKGIIPKAKDIFGSMFVKDKLGDNFINMRWAPLIMVILAFVFTVITDMGIAASIVTILGAWLTTSMSAQCVGQSGINPMEIFGIIILIAAKAVSDMGR